MGTEVMEVGDWDVSVIIPVYNGGRCLGQALESVLAQTYPAKEIIVVDDGSTDNSRAIVEQYAAVNPSIKYLYQNNSGGPAAPRNKAMDASVCPLWSFLDQDDTWDPTKLERQVAVLRQTEADFVYTALVMCDADGRKEIFPAAHSDNFADRLRLGNPIVPSVVLMKRTELRFDEDLHGTEDWDLFFRLACGGAKLTALDQPLTNYNVSRGQLSMGSKMIADDLKFVKKGLIFHGLGRRKKFFCKRKVRASLYHHAGVAARIRGESGKEVFYFMRSLLEWPLPNFLPIRYKALAVTVLRLLHL